MKYKENIIKKMKLKNLKNFEIALIFSFLVINEKRENKFNSKEIIKLFNLWSNEMNYDKKRDFSHELNSYSYGNHENSISLKNEWFYEVSKNNKYEFKIINNGFDYIKKIFKDKWLFNEIKDIEKDIEFLKNFRNEKIETEIKEKKIEEIYELFKNKNFKIPKYQRKYVWKKQQGTLLLKSIVNNYPIGSFLVWEKGRENNLIIDGQQRILTLLKIYEMPFYFFDYNLFHNEISKKIDENKFKEIYEKIKEMNIEKIEESKNVFNDEILFERTLEFLKKTIINNKQKFYFLLIKKSNEDDIIKIFELLNTTGTKLTKFEILASKWSKYNIKIDNRNFMQKADRLYLENFIDKNKNTRDVENNTPAEVYYITLINSLDTGNSPTIRELFREKLDNDYQINNNLLYPLLWIFRVWYAYETKKELDKKIVNDDFDVDMGKYIAEIAKKDYSKIKKLEFKIAEIWKIIEEKVVILKEIKSNKSIMKSISRNLFISLCAQLLNEKLKDENFKINDNIQYHVISEIINKGFASATDSKIKKDIIEANYIKEINTEDIKRDIELHNNHQKYSRKLEDGFGSTVKFIISIAYKFYTKSKSIDFEFDHIFPKKAMEKIEIYNYVNSIGNCGQLEGIENREKRDSINKEELLKDKLIYNGLTNQKIKKEEYEEYIDKINDDSKNNKEMEFKKFVEKREKIIIDLFIDQISL